MFKDKISKYLIAGGMGVVGLVAGIAGIAAAQSATTTTSPVNTVNTTLSTSSTVDTPEAGDVADAPRAHAPLGGDGVVKSINGTTIVMGEESDEGGSSYTIDASHATFSVNGVAGAITDVKVGGKIFVQGPVTGKNVVATSVSVGHPGEHLDKANDTDGNATSEGTETSSSTDANDQ